MARGRMISKTLSTSQKRAALHQVVPDLAEFCQQLYPLLLAHTDDFGRLAGDPFTVKHAVDPTSPRPLADFERALDALDQVGLVVWYETHGRQCLQITNFDPHQLGLHKRTGSDFPAPANFEGLDAFESRVEEGLAADLQVGRLRVGDFTVLAVERQVRRGSSYLDIVATTTVGARLLIEVKRQRVTANAISQVRSYRALLDEPVVPVVIGHGVVADLQLPVSDVLIGTYGDDIHVVTVNPITVNSQRILLNHIPSEGKGREQNLTELKGTEPPPQAASPAVRREIRPATIVQPRRGNAAFEGQRGLYVPQRLHHQFVSLRNHPNAERELLGWYEQVCEEWFAGARKDEQPDPDMFKFWNARFTEKWAPSKATPATAVAADPMAERNKAKYGAMRFGK